MPPSRAFLLLSRALEELGYAEDIEKNGVYLFATYRNAHSVLLQDAEGLTITELAMSLAEQGVDMIALWQAVQRLLADAEAGDPEG